MQDAEEAFGELVIARGNGAVDLEMTDHRLDAVALAVEPLAPADRRLAARARWDDRCDAAVFQIVPDRIAVIALVREHGVGRAVGQIDQRAVGGTVRRFAAGEVERERPAAGITETMNFTGEPAPRAAKSLFASPPFAPAADTWPRTVVASML